MLFQMRHDAPHEHTESADCSQVSYRPLSHEQASFAFGIIFTHARVSILTRGLQLTGLLVFGISTSMRNVNYLCAPTDTRSVGAPCEHSMYHWKRPLNNPIIWSIQNWKIYYAFRPGTIWILLSSSFCSPTLFTYTELLRF